MRFSCFENLLLQAEPFVVQCVMPRVVTRTRGEAHTASLLLGPLAITFAVREKNAICCAEVGTHRSHFGSRYKLGCCVHAGLFSGYAQSGTLAWPGLAQAGQIGWPRQSGSGWYFGNPMSPSTALG